MLDARKILLVQARMGSSRLPKKMALKFGGEVLLGFVLENLRSWKHVDDIIVATSTNDEDDFLEVVARRKGVKVFRGSENNVALRLIEAGFLIGEKTSDCCFFRVCADNPFLCEDLYNLQLEALRTGGGVDYLGFRINAKPAILSDTGIFVEYFNLETLAKYVSSLNAQCAEHATLIFLQNQDDFEVVFMDFKGNLDKRLRLTCDTKADYDYLSSIAGHFRFPITTKQVGEVSNRIGAVEFESMINRRENNKK